MISLELMRGFILVHIEDGFNECWIWCGKMNRNGYGRLSNGKMAHRAMYEMVVAPIPTGLLLDHKCRVRGCVNPHHLEPVTHSENTLRGQAKLFGRDVHPQHYLKVQK